ncbi:GspE/PulE family protein [Candidatus Gracilibacteria bacterium]|nr:GspE/PulE family protein [Candidatus Gracilibacteria bacterium]
MSENNNNFDRLVDAILDGDATQMANFVILHSLKVGASDIHIEPGEGNVRIRIRIDGVLHSLTEYQPSLHDAFIARIKIMSKLQTDEKRIPQDGVINTSLEGGGEVDLRVSTLPTVTGEKVCMRIQDKTKTIPTFKEMGIRASGLHNLETAIKKPNGIVLVTGPTGSGKTTTLYSALSVLNQDGVNIMTVEDPVEIKMAGLNQCQVVEKIGYTFPIALRAALRQDPNIIMLGEIRDKETVEIALRAAMTGHLVLSTIHTNSAVSTINRLLDMGVKPFLIAGTVNAIQAQRLVRRICPNCIEKYTPDEHIIEDIKKELEGLPDSEGLDVSKLDSIVLSRGAGCEECNDTGFKGRMGIYEVLEVDREIEEMVVAGRGELSILKRAKEKGFVTMIQDGIIKAIAGFTTIEEIFNIVNT